MDAVVLAALQKWPHVPHCFGWLGLDARGAWWMRDESAQAAGVFGSNAASRGARLQHEKLLAFIARNYSHDGSGQWYFQNGPQRVYVELESTPWIWRIQSNNDKDSREAKGFTIAAHTAKTAEQVQACYVDEEGHLYLRTELGLGRVHSQDMVLAEQALSSAFWPEPSLCQSAQLEWQFQFVRHPRFST